jgi:hypothetical protein
MSFYNSNEPLENPVLYKNQVLFGLDDTLFASVPSGATYRWMPLSYR